MDTFTEWQFPQFYQFQDSKGEWHLFGADWFASNSEHVTLSAKPELRLVK